MSALKIRKKNPRFDRKRSGKKGSRSDRCTKRNIFEHVPSAKSPKKHAHNGLIELCVHKKSY